MLMALAGRLAVEGGNKVMQMELDPIIKSRCDDVLQKNENYKEPQEELAKAHSSNDINTFS
jgi:hypothetical protein